jgi:hypothetical protein
MSLQVVGSLALTGSFSTASLNASLPRTTLISATTSYTEIVQHHIVVHLAKKCSPP